MFQVGDKVRIIDDLPESAKRNFKHLVNEKIGCICTIKEPDTFGVGDWWVSPIDDSASNFWVMSEWIELYYGENNSKSGCICDIMVLMGCGCKCGQIQRERSNV